MEQRPQDSTRRPRYFDRDLSWIDFNSRVLEEGLRPDLLPLDRFWYLSIVSSNFDEFFMVRVAEMKRALRAGAGLGVETRTAAGVQAQGGVFDPAELSPEARLREVRKRVRAIIRRQYDNLLSEILPALARGGLELVRPEGYSIGDMDYLEAFFMGEIYPVLTPLRIDSADGGHELPAIVSRCLYAAFLLAPENDEDEEEPISIVQFPAILDRIILLPGDGGRTDGEKNGKVRWALLDDVILTWGVCLYPGYRVKDTMLFKINRAADFSVDEQRDEDFIEAMEEVLEDRNRSSAVRMVCSADSRQLREELARYLELEKPDIYEVDGPLDLGSLAGLVHIRNKGSHGLNTLRSRPWKSYASAVFSEDELLWDRISLEDVLIHLPYESFDPVVRFFQDAAADPQVISIKTALYRTSGNSPIVRALEQAALNGKHVTAVVELKARFDEERNISWANRLEKAGVIVVYGLARLKVHAKISMIIRREADGIKRYIHLSTGNYNDKTARQYEDLGLFTVREDIALDASIFFNMITGYSVIQEMRKLVIAPTALKRRLLELIEREAKRSSQEYPGRIMAKMNALVDTDVIEALYRASQAGVKISLAVRGICMLVPGVPGLSEHIQVVSIVGHNLEHSRILYLSNGGAEEYFLSSADWMPRNLERRIELMFPVLQEDLKKRIKDILNAYFRDNLHARALDSSGVWTRLEPPYGEKPFGSQEYFLSQAAKAGENLRTPKQEFTVRRSPPGETWESK
jgi:polyphosphate kinase